MQIKKIFLNTLIVIALAINIVGCKSVRTKETKEIEEKALDKVIYNKVGIHSERKGNAFYTYSTNYIGINTFYKINTAFTLKKINASVIELNVNNSNNTLIIKFVKKHNQQEIHDYFNSIFSYTKNELPKSLTKKELEHIETGTYFIGMSKDALLLSIGFPAMSLNPNNKENSLIYMKKRFNKIKFEMDSDNKIKKIFD